MKTISELLKKKKCANKQCGKSIYHVRKSKGINIREYDIRVAKCCCRECSVEYIKETQKGKKHHMHNDTQEAYNHIGTYWKTNADFMVDLNKKIESQWKRRKLDEENRRALADA